MSRRGRFVAAAAPAAPSAYPAKLACLAVRGELPQVAPRRPVIGSEVALALLLGQGSG